MPYKVLYIDDKPEYLLRTLGCWNKISQQEDVGDNAAYPLMQFIGLSFQNNNHNSQAANGEIHYIDVDNIEQWNKLAFPEQDELQAKLLQQVLEKITEIQPDAILSDIHFGPRSVLSGDVLLKEIRRYYPYMPVVMATRTPHKPDVPYDKRRYYSSAEGLLDLSIDNPENSYGIVCQQCSHAIDYRGIPIQKYTNNEIDTRLPDISWAFIQELVRSPLFEKGSNYPIIFLHGSFGSGRRLFALWMNALLQRRYGEESFPSRLNEINCNCLSTSFEGDQDRKAYIEKLFEPSKDKVLFLTNVDKVPESMQEVFKEVVEKWKQNACIIAVVTDSKHIGLERLPEGIKQIKGFDDWIPLLKKKPSEQKKKTKKNLISFLSYGSTEDFTRQLTKRNIKPNIVHCDSFNYAVSSLSFEEEKNRLQIEVEACNKNSRILIVKDITALEGMPEVAKTDFKDWIDKIKQDACVMINRLGSTGTANRLLPRVLGDHQILEQEDIKNIEITPGSVFYFGHTTRTNDANFADFVRETFEGEAWVFDCRTIFTPTLDMKTNYLTKELKPSKGACDLLFLENVDRVPNDYLDIFKQTVDRCRKDIQIVASITDSSRIGLDNLSNNDDIKQLKLPSLQERFEGYSFMGFNDITDLFSSIFPTGEDIIRRLPSTIDEIGELCLEINEYYKNRLEDINKNELNSQNQQKRTKLLGHMRKNQGVTAKKRFFFQELCQSIVERVSHIIDHPDLKCDGISINAEILLAIQLHDWPEIIFNQSRGIYDLEQILMNTVENTVSRRTTEADISDIQISGSAEKAGDMIQDENTTDMSSTNSELGFEVLARAYAREYQNYHDDPNGWNSSKYAQECNEFYAKKGWPKGPLPPFEGRPLIQSLRGDYDTTIHALKILRGPNGLNKVVTSARNLLNYDEE